MEETLSLHSVSMKKLYKYLWSVINIKVGGLFVFHTCAAHVPWTSQTSSRLLQLFCCFFGHDSLCGNVVFNVI